MGIAARAGEGDLFDRLREARSEAWAAYVGHPFVDAAADGSLPTACFQAYVIQDWLFLIQFARAHALAVYKSRDLDEMRAAQRGLAAILDVEMGLHQRLAARWGLTAADLEGAEEHPATTTYTRFVLDAGMRGDNLDLQVALAPCMVGYAEIATDLARRPGALDAANPHAEWIAEYAGEAYGEVARTTRAELDRLAARLMTPARFDDLADLFGRACRLEADFWEAAWQAGRA